ncbi:MAG TPA: redoxin family protein [Candidatus Hydrogenedens sp.]|nr:redoxin family protein [Candidatus Hydrogenedens sp.]
MNSMVIFKQVMIVFVLIALFAYGEETRDSKQIFLDAVKPLKNAESYEVEAKVVYSIHSEKTGDKPVEIEQKFKIISKGNDLNFLSVETQQQGNIQIFRNGSNLTVYSEKDKKYIEREAPKNPKLFLLIGGPDLLDSIIFGDTELPSSLTIQQATEPSGAPTQNNESQFQIKMDKGGEIKVWLAMGNEPKLTKVQSELPSNGISSGGIMNIYFDNWKLNSVKDESIFKFNPPEGVSKVEKKKDETIEQKAPDFTLSTLDGKKVSLKDFKGKKVVVLDFWAIWCPPCRRAMPIVQEVSNELKDKDVVFLAVNVDEDKAKVPDFVKNAGITLTVLLDTDGKVANSYNVTSIPRMFIIDKNGIIKAGHSGFSAEMKEELKKEILEALK